MGKKKQPMYRIVVADSRSPRDGAFVESLGYYLPLNEPSTIVLDNERARHWLDKGAQPSERVAKLLVLQGVASDLPPKLKQRIALVEKRAAEEKAKPKAEPEAPPVEAAAPAPAGEASAEEPTAEAAAEQPAAEAPAEGSAEPPAEPAASEEPAAEPPADEPAADGEEQG
jgi:small subunit ribosomal protein S16